MEKKSAHILSLIFLVLGLFFLVNSQANITGAVIGVSETPSDTGFFAGAFFILVSFVLFVVSTGRGLEDKIKKIIITDSINVKSSIKKLADKCREDQVVARDLDKLREYLSIGEFNAGLGCKYIGHKIYELRAHKGRLYFRRREGGYEIVGESSKPKQNKAIKLLFDYYT